MSFSFYSPLFEPEAFHLPLMAILFEPVLDTFISQSGCFLVVNKGFIKIAIIISIPQVDIGKNIIRIQLNGFLIKLDGFGDITLGFGSKPQVVIGLSIIRL